VGFFLFIQITAQSPKSGSLKIFMFFAQTLIILIPFTKTNEYMTWLKAFNFDISFLRSLGSEGNSILGCPFQVRSYSKMLIAFIRPMTMFLTFTIIFSISMIVYVILRRRKQKSVQFQETSSDTEMNQISDFNEPNSSFRKLKVKLSSNAGLLAKKTKVKLSTIFFKPHSYALSFVNLLITTYEWIGW
jgi:hypothetical protein